MVITSPERTIVTSISLPKATSLGRRTASLLPLRKVRLVTVGMGDLLFVITRIYASTVSMKIPAADQAAGHLGVDRRRAHLILAQLGEPGRQVGEALGHQVDHLALLLQPAVDDDEGGGHGQAP